MKGADQGRVVAFNKEDGTEVWQFIYEGYPEFSFLQNDKYYIVLNGNILMLNPLTGELIQTIKLGLGPEVIIVVMDDKILIGENTNKTLNYYSMAQQEIISSRPLPDGFAFCLAGFPHKSNQYSYFELKQDHPILNYGGTGLLAVPNSGELDEIEVEDRLAMPMMITADAKGEKTYVFTVSCDSLDDIRRLAAITLAEYAYTHGEPAGVPVTEIDKKHKGKMKLAVDKSILPNDAEEKLIEWAADLGAHFAKMAMFPGAGQKHRFTIEIEMS